MLVGDISSRSSPSTLSHPQSSDMSTPEKSLGPENGMFHYWYLLLFWYCLLFKSDRQRHTSVYPMNNSLPNLELDYYNFFLLIYSYIILVSNSPESPGRRSPPPRYVDGMLALCKSCGYTGFDFSRCQRYVLNIDNHCSIYGTHNFYC